MLPSHLLLSLRLAHLMPPYLFSLLCLFFDHHCLIPINSFHELFHELFHIKTSILFIHSHQGYLKVTVMVLGPGDEAPVSTILYLIPQMQLYGTE